MKKKQLSVIGKPLRKIDAMAKCAGETIFADDLSLPRMIYGKLLRSPHPHARILGINTARARLLQLFQRRVEAFVELRLFQLVSALFQADADQIARRAKGVVEARQAFVDGQCAYRHLTK